MKHTLLFLAVSLAAPAARASDFWAGAAGGLSVGSQPSLGGVVEVGAQDGLFGVCGDVHLSFLPAEQRNVYSAFVNGRLQLSFWRVHPYAIAGVGLANDVPMYSETAAFRWKVGAGLRIRPLPAFFIDGQAGVISLENKYAQVGIGLIL